jgi:deoxyribodipyrimidine photolyase
MLAGAPDERASQVEARVRAAIADEGARLHSDLEAATLCHPEDLPFAASQIPPTFRAFRAAIGGSRDRPPLPPPECLQALPGTAVDEGKVCNSGVKRLLLWILCA